MAYRKYLPYIFFVKFQGKNVDDITVAKFEHLLIVFGGVGGLEQALQVSK